MLRAEDVPEGGLPKHPNPRAQNIDRSIYRDVKRSLKTYSNKGGLLEK